MYNNSRKEKEARWMRVVFSGFFIAVELFSSFIRLY